MFPQAGPQQYGVSAQNQQSTQLLGSPPIQAAASGGINPGDFNNTSLQASNPGVANMIKALKGGQLQ